MTTWQSFAAQAPDLAARVRTRFEANKHHVLATLRRDGSPRVSGTEVSFHGPDLAIGSMPGARKARDLQRDGRFAIHTGTGDSSMDGGDAKVAGVAVEVVDPAAIEAYREPGTPAGPFHLFLLHLTDVTLTSLDGDALAIDTWTARDGVRRVRRR
ncbi:pyridoxamine 5'-phosphate oxidase family protein [Nocardiopsis ansamitocini]|uniref:Pyridoxamine 5'-phosphate oxidase n=1 Tax=Nocardiopsis ansamitocini TaxID=1670832 RepID=A0A9W6P3C3_9ACTN|nr:pyridoxamine 5'-phosphate oxidase family protein [Nocardiopsis ansamitocini]GLU46327.1 pyridoxamine 5'-phosphate oxidase [Nocardiopsis ansamitocini]